MSVTLYDPYMCMIRVTFPAIIYYTIIIYPLLRYSRSIIIHSTSSHSITILYLTIPYHTYYATIGSNTKYELDPCSRPTWLDISILISHFYFVLRAHYTYYAQDASKRSVRSICIMDIPLYLVLIPLHIFTYLCISLCIPYAPLISHCMFSHSSLGVYNFSSSHS